MLSRSDNTTRKARGRKPDFLYSSNPLDNRSLEDKLFHRNFGDPNSYKLDFPYLRTYKS